MAEVTVPCVGKEEKSKWKTALQPCSKRKGSGGLQTSRNCPGPTLRGKTLEEERENLKEAVELVLEANRELAEREIRGKNVVKEQISVSS